MSVLVSLLGRHLKDDDVVEVLEEHEIDVVYDFDRLHENVPDCYWAPAKAAGFQFRFDQNQVLDVVFCYVVEDEGFKPVQANLVGVPLYPSFDHAERACRSEGHIFEVSNPAHGSAYRQLWLRVAHPGYFAHYQFKEGALALVTLSLRGPSVV